LRGAIAGKYGSLEAGPFPPILASASDKCPLLNCKTFGGEELLLEHYLYLVGKRGRIECNGIG